MLLRSDTLLKQRCYYEASVVRPPAQHALQGSERADVVVVGAGFAGLSCAIECAQRGLSVVVLEADRVCSGASGRNGGQAIVGYASGMAPFERQWGPEGARQAWELSLQGIDLIDARIAQFGIDCDRVHAYLHVADSARKARALEAEVHELEQRWGLACTWASGAGVREWIQSPRYQACAFESRSGHLHPLKYGLGLARAACQLGVRIYEHSAVVGLERAARLRARTAHGEVHATWGVLAGNCMLPAYGPRVAPELQARTMPVGTYILGTAALAVPLRTQLIARNAAVCDNNLALDYFRLSADGRLLFGGRVSYTTRTPARLQQRMVQRMVQVFSALRGVPVQYLWGGFVDISMNRAPDFGRLGSNLYYLQGFSGHGLALSGLAGQLVAQALCGQAQRFDLFAGLQHRVFSGGAALRTPVLALGMLYHRIRDCL